ADHALINETNDSVRTNVWYELKRQKITIPFPIRTLEVTRKRTVQPHEEHDRARVILEGEPLFNCLAAEQLDLLIRGSRTGRFGRGGKSVRDGERAAERFGRRHR